MNPSNLSLRQKSRGTVVKTIAIHLYGARDPNYIVDLTLSNLLWRERVLPPLIISEESAPDPHVTPAQKRVWAGGRGGCARRNNYITCAIISILDPVQPAESAFVNIRTLRFCSYAHLWNISCCSEIQCRIGTSQKAWRSARRFPLAAIVKANISACAYRGQRLRNNHPHTTCVLFMCVEVCVEYKLPRWTTRRPNFSGQFMEQRR